MSEVKRIACFFTGGYTELMAMKEFIRKINSDVALIQLCPTKERTSKAQIKNRHTETIRKSHNGLTGNDLVRFMINFVQKPQFQDEEYDAILIEDDKDNRFMDVLPDGTANLNLVKWELFKTDVKNQLKQWCPGIPILFLLAAPEVEAWFLADWENTFAKIYKDEWTPRENSHFKGAFRRYVNNNILTKRYKNSVESYGYFDWKYYKLSEEIQNALAGTVFWKDMTLLKDAKIHYSKKKHGNAMLKEIDPNVVFRHCNQFFKEGYLSLQNL